MSRLSASASPYLRAHAEQPVAWYPWSQEAFAEARRRDVPVLVSIGYSTCHWCHVMAAESFSDTTTAEMMNRDLVAIKVDREEHPEVDAVMMAAAAAFTPHLGWPLSVFTTPEGRPFFAGTYWPKEARGGHPAFRDVVAAVSEAWRERRDAVGETAGALQNALVAAARESATASALPSVDRLAVLVDEIAVREDPQYGGFGASDAPMETPKFPTIPVLRFLQARSLREARPDASALAARTLDAMAAAPLRDPVDGGFFRYATRRDWSVPHYERMLTDNAGLIDVALDAGRDDLARAAAHFLIDTLQQPSGGFGAAQDSESVIDGRRQEGGFYLVGAQERRELAAPAIDGKVVTAWNGAAIGALAAAGARLGSPELVVAARRAVDAVAEANVDEAGLLRRASLDEIRSTAPATLEDYGAHAGGLLRLAAATGECAYAEEARRLVDLCIVDEHVVVPGGRDPVLSGIEAPPADEVDIDRPSGPSALADAALTLWELGAGEQYRRVAEDIVGDRLARAAVEPFANGALLRVAARLAAPPRQIVVVARTDADPLARAAFRAGADTVVRVSAAEAAQWSRAGFSLLAERIAVGGRSTAYDCRGFVCLLPVHTPAEIAVESAAGA